VATAAAPRRATSAIKRATFPETAQARKRLHQRNVHRNTLTHGITTVKGSDRG